MAAAKPQLARELATRARREAIALGDGVALSLAEEALGLAARQFHDIGSAIHHLRRAVSVAEARGLALRAAEARASLAISLAWAGKNTAALREADLAAEWLTGEQAARLQRRRATILQRLGRLEEALEGYRQALAVFRRTGDTHGEAHLLTDRGVLHAYRGEFHAAQADLLRSERLLLALGEEFEAAKVRHNYGFVAARRGDIPTALDSFDRAKAYFDSQEMVDAVGLLDRCEALLSARLIGEARTAAERAVTELAKGGMGLDLPEARLMLSHAALLEGDVEYAAQTAKLALREFTGQRRTGWAALARHSMLRAEWAGGELGTRLLRAADRTRAALEASGWVLPALDARLIAGRIALALGQVGRARAELTLASRARYRGPIELRSRAWHAEALLRRASGNRRGTSSAVRAGLQMLEQHRAALGATELRAHVTAHAEDLAALGLRQALESRRPERLLVWAERWRAASLRLHPVRPPADGELAASLGRLRRVVAELERATADGDTAAAALLHQQATLERTIRDRMRHARGSAFAEHAPPSMAALQRRLGDRVLVEMVKVDQQLHAVVVDERRATLHHLAPLRVANDELLHLRSALRRLAYAHGSQRSLAAAEISVEHGARRLEELLIGPAHARVAGRSLVMVPTGMLHALPWSLLPALADAAVTVSPSATFWWHASRRAVRDGPGRTVLIAGPRLPHAAREVDALAGSYRSAHRLVGQEATVDAVKAALDGAGLAHIAAHGVFRSDNPLFSSIDLADGRLIAYDLEGLDRAPRTVVLSACDSGLSSVQPGDELMGLAATLFSLGTRTLIASVIPVPDEAARALMVAFHDKLQRGLEPVRALAGAQAQINAGRGGVLATRAGFVCFGAG